MVYYEFHHRLRGILIIITTIVVLGICAGLAGEDEASTMSIDNLIKSLAAMERRLVNLRVESEMWQEEKEPDMQDWTRRPVHTVSTAWYNGMPGSQARIDMHKDIGPWRNGAADFIETCYSIGFDGRFGRTAKHHNIVDGEMIKEARGEVLPNRPKRFDVMGHSTGTSFSIFFWKNDRSISQFISEIVRSGKKLTVAEEKFQGIQSLQVTTGNQEWGCETWWLDKSRNLALIGYEVVNVGENGQPVLVISDRITELVESSPGIWYPTEAVRTRSILRAGGSIVRSHFKASKVVANDPGFDESIFTVDFPPGYRIYDKVADIRYVRGPTPRQLQKMLDTLISDLDNIGAQGENLTAQNTGTSAALPVLSNVNTRYQEGGDAKSTTVSSDITDVGVHRILSKKSTVRWMLLGAIGLVFLAAIVFTIIRFMRGSSKTTIVLLLLLMYPLSNISMGSRLSGNETGLLQKQNTLSAYHLNCGVNAGYIVLRLFDIPISVSEVADKLAVGEAFEQSVSLLELKTLFWENGLSIEGFRASDPNEMLGFLNGDKLLVVHTSKRLFGRGFGHYLIFTGSEEYPFVIDPPRVVSRFERGDLVKLNPTGNFLVVSKKTEPPTDGRPSISVENECIDLGHIPLTASDVRGKIRFRNDGSEELKIIRVQGPCNCLLEWSGDTVLPAGQCGQIQIVFDKSKLPDGHMTRIVKLLTNDPKNEIVKVNFDFTIQKVPKPKDIRVLPQMINYGRISRQKIASDATQIKLIIPRINEGLAKYPHVEIMAKNSLLEITELSGIQSHSATYYTSDRVIMYEISWRQAPNVGILKEDIRFVIDRKPGGKSIIEVPIIADVLPK